MNVRLSKTVTVVAVACLLMTGTALAQKKQDDRDWQKGPPSVEEKLARISDALNLSDEQAVDMLMVLQKQAADKAAIHEQTMALMGPEICAQRAEAEEAILGILDEVQTELFLEIKEQRQERAGMKEGRGKRRAALDCSD